MISLNSQRWGASLSNSTIALISRCPPITPAPSIEKCFEILLVRAIQIFTPVNFFEPLAKNLLSNTLSKLSTLTVARHSNSLSKETKVAHHH